MNHLYVTIVGLAVATITGCAARVPLQYDYPAARLKADGSVIVCRSTDDQRTDRTIDETLDGGSASAVDRAIQEEVASAGIAQKVVVLPGIPPQSHQELKNQGISMVIEPTLEEMAWEVPDYEQLLATTFIVSVFTGGVGGLVYTSTPTDVYGRTRLTVRMIDVSSGRQATKTYVGVSQDRMAKLSSDQPETKSKMVGQSLSSAMQQFRTDLVSFFGPRPAP